MSPRRVVIGVDGSGHSTVISDDGLTPGASSIVGGSRMTLWRGSPPWELPLRGAPIETPLGNLTELHLPDPGEVRFGVFSLESGGGASKAESSRETYGPDGMHATDTIDVGVVLSGQLRLRLEDGNEIDLTSGDVVIQLGTVHSWSNVSDEPCSLVFGMIGVVRKEQSPE